MTALRVSPTGTHFLAGDEPRFLLADTVWAAFTRPTTHEWKQLMRLRRRQGFTAVNISVLPIPHDRTGAGRDRSPFATDATGTPDLDRLDPGYFEHARAMTAIAVQAGLVPVLVVLWCNYVPGTWGAEITPDLVLSQAQTDAYVELVARSFAEFDPIFCVSGDERFATRAATDRYVRAARQLREAAPDCLRTTHPAPIGILPPELADLLDCYAYQSGHDAGWDTYSYEQAETYRSLPTRRPVISMEPCYEGHGYGGGAGRHTAASVRRASWSALLAGAGGGLGYGAHGVWSWHRPGEAFNGEHFSGRPFPAEVALQFRGAWDVGLLRQIAERFGLYDLRARQDLLIDDRSGARIGASETGERIVVWSPHPVPLSLDVDLTGWRAHCWNLDARQPDRVAWRVCDGRTVIEQPEFLADALYVFQR